MVKVILPAFPYIRLRPLPLTRPLAQVLDLMTQLRSGSRWFSVFSVIPEELADGAASCMPLVSLP